MEELEQDPAKWTPLERIRYLLDHWSFIFDPGIMSGVESGGGSGGVALLPQMAHHSSVVELAGCLGSLAAEHADLYRHLKAYRCNAEWRQRRTKIKFRGPNGRMLEGNGWRKERIVPSWVRLDKVADAEAWIVREFRGEVFIPMDLWRGLTEPVGA